MVVLYILLYLLIGALIASVYGAAGKYKDKTEEEFKQVFCALIFAWPYCAIKLIKLIPKIIKYIKDGLKFLK